jgi:hypothetical protein
MARLEEGGGSSGGETEGTVSGSEDYDPGDSISESATDYQLRASGRDWTAIFQQITGGIALAGGAAFTTGVLSLADLALSPIQAITDVMRTAPEAFIGTPLEFLIASGDQASSAITSSPWTALGPFLLPFGLIIVLLTAWILSRFLREDETSNLIPFLSFDLPFLGREEEGNERGLFVPVLPVGLEAEPVAFIATAAAGTAVVYAVTRMRVGSTSDVQDGPTPESARASSEVTVASAGA